VHFSGLLRGEQDVEELRPRAVFTVDREVLRLAALAERLDEHEADDLRDVWRDDDEVFLPLLLDTDLLRRSSISESLSSLPNPAFRRVSTAHVFEQLLVFAFVVFAFFFDSLAQEDFDRLAVTF